MTEAQLQQMVVDLARYCGYLSMHIHDSRKSSGAGFPDLVLVHKLTGRVLFIELKSDTGRIRPEQHVWMGALQKRQEAHIWRPEDWTSGAIRQVLTTDPVEMAA